MNYEEFVAACSSLSAPDLPPALKALFLDRQGKWDAAHEAAQEGDTIDGAWVHAYLHRKEGDISNARYWYNRASRAECRASLEEEWEMIARELLG